MKKQWLTTDYPEILFEDNEVGRMKKEVWDATDEQVDAMLEEYGIPSDPELGKPNTYIQTTPRAKAIEKRKKNDVVLIPVGCTENHGLHQNTGLDTFMVTQICEGVRRYTAKQGREVNLALPPLNYGGHPHHHLGMPGTVMVPEEVVKEMMIAVMLGLWDDGYRKMVIVNNHGHLWMLVSAIQEFMKRYQVPAIVQVIDWHRAVREFFYVTDRDDSLETNFVHAAEAETSVSAPFSRNGRHELRPGYPGTGFFARRTLRSIRRSLPAAPPLVRGRRAHCHRALCHSRRSRGFADEVRPLQGEAADPGDSEIYNHDKRPYPRRFPGRAGSRGGEGDPPDDEGD